MLLKSVFVAAAIAGLFCCTPTRVEAAEDYHDLVKADLAADFDHIRPGQSFKLGVRLKMKEHWHTYWANPGENGQPTEIKWTGPEGVTFGEIHWPLPKKLTVDGATIYGYEDEVLLIVPVTTAESLPHGKLPIKANVEWLSCKETCIEGKADLSLDLMVSPESNPANIELFAKYEEMLPIAADRTPAKEVVAAVEQRVDAAGKTAPSLRVRWKQKPKKIDWYPLASPAVAVSDVKIEEASDLVTDILCQASIFAPGEGRVGGVLVYEDADGKRVGVDAPMRVDVGGK